MQYQVKCVNKDSDDDVTHIGGDGFRFPLAEAIDYIKRRVHSFYTLVADQRGDVYVTTHPASGKEFLKTTADTTTINNLDELPRCQ